MYKQILQTEIKLTGKDVIWCIPYEIFHNIDLPNDWFVKTFQKDPTDNSYVIYKSTDEGFLILGNIDTNDDDITTSKYYDSFRKTSLIHNDVGTTDELSQFNYIHLNWVFDNCLREKKVLEKIFATILYNENAIVWCDSNQCAETIYYSVKRQNYIKAISFFATKFLTE